MTASKPVNALGLPQDKRIVLALAGAYLPRPYVHFRTALDNLLPYLHTFGETLHFVFVAGNDVEYAGHLRRACSDLGISDYVTVLEYVEGMAGLMAASDLVICKSGGLTVTECLCAQVPMILLGRAYGQENANVRLLTVAWRGHARHHLARAARTRCATSPAAPRAPRSMLVNGSFLRRPDAARDIARATMKLGAMPRKTQQTRCTRSTSSTSIGGINPRTCDRRRAHLERIYLIMTHFDDLGLSGQALQAVAQLGYRTPTPVQEQAIPKVLEGRDLIAAAKTGTGKTAAFSAAHHGQVSGMPRASKGPLMLVVTPTRELAEQIGEVCGTIAKNTHHRILTVVGGVSYNPQIQAAQPRRRRAHRHAGPPGRPHGRKRAAHSEQRGSARAGRGRPHARHGLLAGHDARSSAATPQDRQTPAVQRHHRPHHHEHGRQAAARPRHGRDRPQGRDRRHGGAVRHARAAGGEARAAARAVLKERGSQARHRVLPHAQPRGRHVPPPEEASGTPPRPSTPSRSQNQRRRALENFANGTTDVLVATDVLARGIDVEEVEYVVNYDLPTQPEDYVHRIGRTGRAGAYGFAVSFVSPETADALRDIQKLLKRTIPELELQNFDMHEAENEAAARAQRAEARRDPEIQQAKKEQAARKRRKDKAREAAQAEEVQHPPHQAWQLQGRGEARQRDGATPRGSAATPITARSASAAPAQRNASANRAKANSASGTQNGDFRPGRAHRAQVAHQRNRRR